MPSIITIYPLFLLLAFALALALALLTLLTLLALALLALVSVQQRLGHVRLRCHLAHGQCHRLLWCPQLDLNGVLLVLRLRFAAQLDEEHIAVGLLARFITHLRQRLGREINYIYNRKAVAPQIEERIRYCHILTNSKMFEIISLIFPNSWDAMD